MTLTIYSESWILDKAPVVNASPLIYLSKAGLLGLLQIVSSEIFVPQKVATEILQRGRSDITAALKIPVRGTLGIVLIAKQRGEIDSARQLLERLRHAGMYLSDSVINRALALVKE